MLPWAGLLFMCALGVLLFCRAVARSEFSLVWLPFYYGCFALGGVAFEVLRGARVAELQERVQDFDTVPVCFRTDEVAPQEDARERVPRGLFCCRQAGSLSCAVDWRSPRLGIDDE